ncbi:MAG: 6-carboxytetrahydropterin synthase [Casimicrobiaceae bacterium]|nr:6-carboxytetrahydropterin synthase [Casimicrobiaceae bacterium]MCX8097582.1 6-carboxytetrahydropterin synthase [Casimicrobiaceae bacterium]MDW8312086.1 6-carboxytetrahydropterin synthase [Burkholderiales bacterium]
MRYEIHQRFFFDAAHTLEREIEAEGSRRVHGHTYWCEVCLAGTPDPRTGMLLDLAHLREHLATLRERLDHRLLNELEGLGPPTLENLCAYIWRAVAERFEGVSRVRIWREGIGDGCTLTALPHACSSVRQD